MNKEMQNACAKTAFIANFCGLNSLLKPDTVRHALCSSVKMDSWLLKQSENVEKISIYRTQPVLQKKVLLQKENIRAKKI
jgi:hypothetical protein